MMTILSQVNSVIDREDEMKTFRRILCFSLALICLVLSLTSCTNRMVMTGRGLTNKKTGIEYSYVLNPAYQPIEYSDEAYTKWKYNKITVEYFSIKGLKEDEWLYCPTLGELLCSTGEELPELGGFESNGALICIEATIPYSIYEIKDQEFIDKIVARYTDPATPSYSTVMATSNYSIKFTSEKYPEFYYSLVLVADVDGTYIHDRMTGRYIDMGDLFDEYELYDLGEYDEE